MNSKSFYVIAFVLLAAGLFINLGEVPLKLEEPRRALVSLEMMLSGDYIVPTVNGEPYYKKPPAFNWALVGVYLLTGNTSEWVTRLPTVISFLAVMALLILAGRKYINEEFGLLAGLLFATSVRLLFYGVNYAEIDLFFSLILLLSVLGFYEFYQKGYRYPAFLLAYFFCGLGILTKSLPALAFTSISITAYLMVKRDFRSLISLAHVSGILLMLLMVSAYLLALSGRVDLTDYFTAILGDSTQRTAINHGSGDFFKHIIRFPLELLWSILPGTFLLFFAWKLKGRLIQTIRDNEYIFFSTIVFIANFWMYWFSPGARMRYLFILFPFILNLLAYFYTLWKGEDRNKIISPLFLGLCIIIGIGMIAVLFFQDLEVTHQLILIAGGLLILMLPWAWRYTGWDKFGGIITMILLARICFALVVLPIRAEGSDYLEKEDAKAVSMLLENKPLYVTKADTIYNRPIFYLTQDKNEIIREKSGGSGYYMLFQEELKPSDSLVYEFRSGKYAVVFRND